MRAHGVLACEVERGPGSAGPDFPQDGAIEEPSVGVPDRITPAAVSRRGLDVYGEVEGLRFPER
jgi:hypothetical protein